MGEPKSGDELRWSRLVTEADIRAFAELSGDKGAHHLEKDAKGRLLAHGLLTATLPTKLGGDLDYIAGTMLFRFLRPVYAGDALDCTGRVEAVVEEARRWKVSLSFFVTNQNGKRVLEGTTDGAIYKERAGG